MEDTNRINALPKKFKDSSPNDDTFLVLVKRRGKAEVIRFSRAKSLYLFRHNRPIRKFAIALTTNLYFEYFILFLIVANCVFLALKNPPEEPEYVFACLYTIEMFLKIIARGFAFHKHAYLRDPWNVLDFLVVILGWLTITPYVANLSGVRTFRVLRALRTISQTKGLKTMVNTLLVSMRMLSDVLVLILFFLCVFALLGMQLFMGELRNKCSLTIPEETAVNYARYVSNSSKCGRVVVQLPNPGSSSINFSNLVPRIFPSTPGKRPLSQNNEYPEHPTYLENCRVLVDENRAMKTISQMFWLL